MGSAGPTTAQRGQEPRSRVDGSRLGRFQHTVRMHEATRLLVASNSAIAGKMHSCDQGYRISIFFWCFSLSVRL